MKILIISDTHIKKNHDKMDKLLSHCLNDADAIIHLGDFTDKEVLDRMMKLKNFIGVYGNADSNDIKNTLPEDKIIEIEEYKIGIFHGHGAKKSTLERAYERFKDKNVDIIVFGHSHQPIIKTKNNILFLNPGSITDKRKERWFSYIVLEISKGLINAQLRFFHKNFIRM